MTVSQAFLEEQKDNLATVEFFESQLRNLLHFITGIEFGLYDNDEQIDVLDRGDLYRAIGSNDLWFIKVVPENCFHTVFN